MLNLLIFILLEIIMYTKEQLQEKGLHNHNVISWRFYLGLWNQLALKAKGFASPERLTFYQAKTNGLKIKRGSKGVEVIYENVVPVGEFVDGELVEEDAYYRRVHRVFNMEQTEEVLDPKQD